MLTSCSWANWLHCGLLHEKLEKNHAQTHSVILPWARNITQQAAGPFVDDGYPDSLIRMCYGSDMLVSFTCSFPNPWVICKASALLWYVPLTLTKFERNLSHVHPKQFRSWYHPQNLCTSGWVKKRDNIRKVCVPVLSLQQEHMSNSWMLPWGKAGCFSDHCHPYLHPVKASYLVLGQFPEALAQCSESFPSRERMSLCVAPWFEQCTSSFLCDCALSAGHTQTDRQSCYGSRHLNRLGPLPKISVCYCFH